MRLFFALLSISFFISTNAQTLPIVISPTRIQRSSETQRKVLQETKTIVSEKLQPVLRTPIKKELKLVIVTLDGYRWQEEFGGVSKMLQKRLLKDPKFDKDFANKLMKGTREEKRKTLMPFMWSTMVEKGSIIGNRRKGNKLTVHNPYFFSYPGYSELFCGYVDKKVNSNDHPDNQNLNLFDFLLQDDIYKNSIAAFGNWDAFPKILNANRNHIPVFHTYGSKPNIASAPPLSNYDKLQTQTTKVSAYAEKDTIVYQHAKEYLVRNHPKAFFIGLDETDHFGHSGNYPAYVMAAYQSDVWLNDLWNTLQADPFYKDQTILIVTCDHGRGPGALDLWRTHGQGLPASGQTWLAIMGPGVKALGEDKDRKHYHHDQIAATLAKLLGKDFTSTNKKIGKPIEAVIEK
jgi:hypothetical protein